MTKIRKGSCLCGGISYEIIGPMTDITSCHCTQCRKQSGHHYAASRFAKDQLVVEDDQNMLTWFQASDDAHRGFCSNCGSALFWKAEGSEYCSVMVGTIDGPTGLKHAKQIYTADKGDYYELDYNVPVHSQNG